MAHRIRQGECVSVIAARNGMGWRRIWDAAENQALHEAGRHPNVLLPGDALHVPKLELGIASAPTDQHHRFVLHGTTVTVHIKLVADLEALPDEPWVIEHPGGTLEGTSDGEGLLEARLPALLEQATLLLPKRRFRYTLLLGALDPLETPSGARARLRNLGLGGLGELDDGELDGELAEELRDFQRAQALDESAELDDATLDALRDEYGI
jgi:hypothetical protein